MAKNKTRAFRTSIGGQALIEGILMRGPDRQAIVVRKPDGTLEEKVEPLHFIKERYPILGLPLIRGVVMFLDSMVKGMRALLWSAEFLPEEEQEQQEQYSKDKQEDEEGFHREGPLFGWILREGLREGWWACPLCWFHYSAVRRRVQ